MPQINQPTNKVDKCAFVCLRLQVQEIRVDKLSERVQKLDKIKMKTNPTNLMLR